MKMKQSRSLCATEHPFAEADYPFDIVHDVQMPMKFNVVHTCNWRTSLKTEDVQER